jgi:hypothetical protein
MTCWSLYHALISLRAGLSPEQQAFIVLADTVLKQLDSCKAAEAGVGGPVRR